MDEKKNEKYRERNTRAKEFEMRHRVFLEQLRHTPKDRKEERWIFFKQYAHEEAFTIELMDAYRPGTYSKIKNRLENEPDKSSGADTGFALYGKKGELDGVVFMEAVKDAIQDFTGINQQGDTYGFVEYVGKKYKQRADRAAGKDELEKKGASGLSDKKVKEILNLAKDARKFCVRSGGQVSEGEAVKQVVKDYLKKKRGKSDAKVRETEEKQLLELVGKLVLSENIAISIDAPVSGGNDEKTVGDFLADEKNEYELWAEEEGNRFLIETFFDVLAEKWEYWGYIEAAKGLKEQDLVKKFLTQDILKVLKLDEEDNRYLEEPAGNREIYDLLKPKEDFFYHEIFYRQYLHRALVRNPESLYEVYALLLREDFEFTDKILAEVMGKDKTSVSKRKKRYRDDMKAIQNFCLSRR